LLGLNEVFFRNCLQNFLFIFVCVENWKHHLSK
jgi:hypothetical protein